MKTETIKKTIKDILNFAKENGYIFAVYVRKNINIWQLNNNDLRNIIDDIDENNEIVVYKQDNQLDYNITYSMDGKYMFLLHNNYNLKTEIPCTF